MPWHSFLSLESPHPYGVLPAGNRFLLSNADDASSEAAAITNKDNSALRQKLCDETWLTVLGFLDGPSLAQVVQSCRFFYVAGHQPELWRDLVLSQLKQNKAVLDRAETSWKDTFVMLSSSDNNKFIKSKPMKIPEIYSDYLYRLHSCRSFAIPLAWLKKSDPNCKTHRKNGVPRVLVQDMTCDKFVTQYERANQPVVIAEAAKTWKAFRDWQDPMYLRKHTSGRTLRATSGMAPLPVNFTMAAFQQYCQSTTLEEGPLYLFDRAALNPGSHLHQDFYQDLQRTCPYFDPNRTIDSKDDDLIGHDLFQVLGEGKRPDHTWAIIGGTRSGSVFHIDPNATHAWNAAMVGRKRWLFYPPGVTPPGVYPSSDGESVALPLSVGEWILTFWREHQHQKATAPPSRRPLEVTAFPGDVVFVPHGWWHMVINLDKINIAVTHNYVSRSNLGSVLRFLECKEEQISGCRDRAESIKPNKLHATFAAALQEEFGKDAEWLVSAREESESRWTCKAWNNDDVRTKRNDPLLKKRRLNATPGEDERNELGNSVMLKAKTNNDASSGGAPFSFSFL